MKYLRRKIFIFYLKKYKFIIHSMTREETQFLRARNFIYFFLIIRKKIFSLVCVIRCNSNLRESPQENDGSAIWQRKIVVPGARANKRASFMLYSYRALLSFYT